MQDRSAYVRRTAVMGIVKLFYTTPSLITGKQMLAGRKLADTERLRREPVSVVVGVTSDILQLVLDPKTLGCKNHNPNLHMANLS